MRWLLAPYSVGGMALDADMLRSSFELVTTREPDVTRLFYDELFSRYPQAQALFTRKSREAQERMLAEALTAVLDHLEDAVWLETTLAGLGAQHVEYGVTDEMYGWVGECLLATFARVAGSDWSSAHETAWTEAYGAVTSLMAHPVAST
jgi:hemoglobin-like flavoprotein